MKKKGFTLIELLVVIAIIGILATIVLVSLNTARSKARDARRVADLKQVALALEMYYDDAANRQYPGDKDKECFTGTTCTSDLDALVPKYMAALPVDPINVATGTATHVYKYYVNDDFQSYILAADAMEDTPPPNIDVCTDAGNLNSKCDCLNSKNIYCIGP